MIIPPNITGTVVSVDLSDYTCVVKPTDGSSNFEGVRLKATVDGSTDGLVCEPEVNSIVIISPLFNNEHAFFVSRFSSVKKWHLKVVGGGQIEIDNTGKIKINGDAFGGIPKAGSVAAKLNILETQLTNLKAAITAWVVASGDGGAALKVSLATWLGQAVAQTTQANIESPNVKHG